MDPEKIMNGLFKELNVALKDMSKSKTVEAKLAHSQVVKNLCESIGVFLDLASDLMPFEDFDE